MANISGNGAPNKLTVGKIGDVYTNNNTNEQFKCVNVYHFRTMDGEVVEYEWKSSKTGTTGDYDSAISSLTSDVNALKAAMPYTVTIDDVNKTVDFSDK